jgi:hypothetical protein
MLYLPYRLHTHIKRMVEDHELHFKYKAGETNDHKNLIQNKQPISRLSFEPGIS